MCANAKMIPVETFLGIGGQEIKESSGRGSSMIYLIHCKNLYKCHNVLPPNTIIKRGKK
jgi:hypothetical protein